MNSLKLIFYNLLHVKVSKRSGQTSSGKGARGSRLKERFGCADAGSSTVDDPRHCQTPSIYAGLFILRSCYFNLFFILFFILTVLSLFFCFFPSHPFQLRQCVQPHGRNGKFRPRALRDLSKQYLQMVIQTGEHDPVNK